MYDNRSGKLLNFSELSQPSPSNSTLYLNKVLFDNDNNIFIHARNRKLDSYDPDEHYLVITDSTFSTVKGINKFNDKMNIGSICLNANGSLFIGGGKYRKYQGNKWDQYYIRELGYLDIK